MNRAEMAVAFGRRRGFASGRLGLTRPVKPQHSNHPEASVAKLKFIVKDSNAKGRRSITTLLQGCRV
jgi:hypothetical protein